jgi:hypothetical protein
MKTLISALIISLVTFLSTKLPKAGALIMSLPITSLIVFFIMKYEGRTDSQIATMSWDTFKMIIPSLILFIILPVMINRGGSFYLSLTVATVVTSLSYMLSYKLLA